MMNDSTFNQSLNDAKFGFQKFTGESDISDIVMLVTQSWCEFVYIGD